jgi:hypothetical protein
MQGVAHGRNCGGVTLKTALRDADALLVIPPRTLADVFDELAEVSLDPQAVLDITAARCAEIVGDGCLIRLISEDGTELQPVAFGHTDPERRAFIEELLRGRPQRVGEGVAGKVAQTGRVTFIPAMPNDPELVSEPVRPSSRATPSPSHSPRPMPRPSSGSRTAPR